MNQARLEELAAVLNLFPEVRWDRTAGTAGSRVAFGWVDRADGRADFLLVTFTAKGAVGFTTSSAEHSAEWHRRLYGTDAGHSSCRRVEDVFGELVANAIHIEDLPLNVEASA